MTQISLDAWKALSKTVQTEFAELLGDRTWDEYNLPKEANLLKHKIAFAFFAEVPNEEGQLKESEKSGIITELHEKCSKYCSVNEYSSELRLAFFFVHLYYEENGKSFENVLPMIRLCQESEKEQSHYLDQFGRIYQNWEDFLKNNQFGKCWICVPRFGEYTFDEKSPCLEYHDQSKRGVRMDVLDVASTVSNVVGSCGMLTGIILSAIPPFTAIGVPVTMASAALGTPGALFGTGRSVYKLIDRSTHGQTLSLANSEARACWLVTAASVLNIGAMASAKLVSSLAEVGVLVGVCHNSIAVANVSLSGLGIINAFIEISKKDKIEAMDVLQLTTSVFFFTHSLVTFQTAKSLVKEAQGNGRQARGNQSGRQRRNRSHRARNRGQTRDPKRETKVFVKKITTIDSTQEFFNKFTRSPSESVNVSHVKLTKRQRTVLLKQSEQVRHCRVNNNRMNNSLKAIRQQNRARTNAMNKSPQNATDTWKSKGIPDSNSHTRDLEVSHSQDIPLKPYVDTARQLLNLFIKLSTERNDETHMYPSGSNQKLDEKDELEIQHEYCAIEPDSRDVCAIEEPDHYKNPHEQPTPSGVEDWLEYLEPVDLLIIAETTVDAEPIDVSWTRDRNIIKCCYTSEEFGLMSLRFELLAEGMGMIVTIIEDDGLEEAFLFATFDEEDRIRMRNDFPIRKSEWYPTYEMYPQ